MNVCACFHTSVFRGVTTSICSWVTRLSPDTFSEYVHGPHWDGVRNTGKDDVPSRPPHTPVSSLAPVFTSAHSETCLVVLVLKPLSEGSVGVSADFQVQWPESEIPRFEPLFKGFPFVGMSGLPGSSSGISSSSSRSFGRAR